jgi:hypothetical protein
MEPLALLTWLLLAGTGVFLLPFVLSTPGAGLAGLAGLGGLAASFLAILLGAPDCTGWAQVGMATLGIVSAALAGAWLGDEKFTSGTGRRSYRPEWSGFSSVVRRRYVHLAAHRRARHRSCHLSAEPIRRLGRAHPDQAMRRPH